MRLRLRVVAVALVALGIACVPMRAISSSLTCTLQRSGAEFNGACEVPCQVNELAVNFDGIKPNFSCNTPTRRVAASLRRIENKEGAWIGAMEGRQPEDPKRFEIIEGAGGASGVAKVPFGWFALQSFHANENELSITVAVDKQLSPAQDGIRILERARQLLAIEGKWNKQDDRTCHPNPERWSLFCALLQATMEVSGDVHYRQPALQAAREVLNEVGGSRFGKHRIMDYNNHPDTTLEDIHQLLRSAQSRLEKRLPR